MIKQLRTRTPDSQRRLGAARLSRFADTPWRATARTVEAGLDQARQALADPRVQAEAKSSLTHLMRASRRVYEIGPTQAIDDKKLRRHLSRASNHASNAVDSALHPRRSQTWLRSFAIIGGAALAVSSAYAAWRAHSRDGSEPHGQTDAS